MNYALLEVLRARAGEWSQPRTLADHLFISLAEVDAAVEELRRGGYVIECKPRLGYRFQGTQDRLLAYEIARGLGTAAIGTQVECHDRVGSTNDLSWQRVYEGAPEGHVTFAEEQAAGRGRMGRTWECRPGNGILMSVVLRPPLAANEGPLLTVMASVATAQAVHERFRLAALIRWPNDITISGRKVGGILVEARSLPPLSADCGEGQPGITPLRGGMTRDLSAVRSAPPAWSHEHSVKSMRSPGLPTGSGHAAFVLGIGINVNTPVEDFSEGLRGTATSIRAHLLHPVSRMEFARSLLRTLDRWYGLLLRGEKTRIAEYWRNSSCTLGRHVVLAEGGKEYRGRVLDLSLEHGLIVQLERGSGTRIFHPSLTTLIARE